MDRRAALLWVRDVLDHLSQAYDQWQEADGSAARLLADAMQRDVNELHRLCASLRAVCE